jgi:hypothetical protein
MQFSPSFNQPESASCVGIAVVQSSYGFSAAAAAAVRQHLILHDTASSSVFKTVLDMHMHTT